MIFKIFTVKLAVQSHRNHILQVISHHRYCTMVFCYALLLLKGNSKLDKYKCGFPFSLKF